MRFLSAVKQLDDHLCLFDMGGGLKDFVPLEIATEIATERDALLRAAIHAGRILQSIWYEGEMGWVTADGSTVVECGLCTAQGDSSNLLDIEHNEGCEQGEVHAALVSLREVILPPPTDKPGTCRSCGCTKRGRRGCGEPSYKPFSWVEPDLCSACFGFYLPLP